MKVTAALSRIPFLGPSLHVYMCECTCVSGGVGPRREGAELWDTYDWLVLKEVTQILAEVDSSQSCV